MAAKESVAEEHCPLKNERCVPSAVAWLGDCKETEDLN